MSWVRRNRWWLLALPLALAAVVAASAYNAKVFWFDSGLHHRIAGAEPGEFVSVTDDYSDPYGDTSRTLRVRLRDVGTITTYPTRDGRLAPPDGLDAVVVRLDFEADPDETLNFCNLAVLDDDGRRYEVPDPVGQPTPCLPSGRGGPVLPLTEDVPRGYVEPGSERPPTWQSWPIVLMPEGARVDRVLIWWDYPDYVELPAP